MTRDNAAELGVPPVPGSDVLIEIDLKAHATKPKVMQGDTRNNQPDGSSVNWKRTRRASRKLA
jgi:hypothetical protein